MQKTTLRVKYNAPDFGTCKVNGNIATILNLVKYTKLQCSSIL